MTRSDRSSKLALAWISRGDYGLMRAVVTEPTLLPTYYRTWVERCRRAVDGARRAGFEPLFVVVLPHLLLEWCDRKAIPPNGASLQRYVFEAGQRCAHDHRQTAAPVIVRRHEIVA